MTDLDEAAGEHMQQKTPDELDGVERHLFHLVVVFSSRASGSGHALGPYPVAAIGNGHAVGGRGLHHPGKPPSERARGRSF